MSFAYHRDTAANLLTDLEKKSTFLNNFEYRLRLAELHMELAKAEAAEHLALGLTSIAATFAKRS